MSECRRDNYIRFILAVYLKRGWVNSGFSIVAWAQVEAVRFDHVIHQIKVRTN